MLVPFICAVFMVLRKFLESNYQLRPQEIAPFRQRHFLFFGWHSRTIGPKTILSEGNPFLNHLMTDAPGRDGHSSAIVKNLLQNGSSRFAPNTFAFFAMKAKRTLPGKSTGREPRRRSGMSQKEERDAIDAALKRLMGDDGFRPRGVLAKRKPA